MKLRAWLQGSLALAASAPLLAGAMQPLSDSALSAVRGGDGVSFDLNGFSMNGDARITYSATPTSSIYAENLTASRSDNAQPFSDPYLLDVVPGAPGMADVINLAFPLNTNGSQVWQFAYDWGVNSDGINSANGSVVMSNLVLTGGGLQFSTPQTNDGVAFGVALKMDIGQLAFLTNGRSNSADQMTLTGVHIGGVDASGNFDGTPWTIASVATQPGVINAVTDSSGSNLHIGIDWPANGTQAPIGSIAVDNISFSSPGQSTVDLGSSRIGTIQIQYLDIKFKH